MEKIKFIVTKILSHSLTKGSLIIFVGSMLSNLFSYFYHFFVGRILGPKEYGELMALFSLFVLVNIPSDVVRLILVKFFSILKANRAYGQAKKLIFLSSGRIITFLLIGIVVFWLMTPFLTNFLHINNQSYFYWLYLIFALSLLSTATGSALQGFQLFYQTSVCGNIGMLLRLLIAVPFSFWGIGWTLIGNAISSLLGYLLHLFPLKFLFLAKSEDLTSITRRTAVRYSLPTLLTAIGMTALSSQDVVLVKHFFSAYDSGIYSSLSVLGKIIFFASSSIGHVMFPVVAERSELKRPAGRLVIAGLILMAVISFGLTAVYFLAPNLVVALLYGSSYLAAAGYLGWFGIFISMFSLSSLLINICLASGKTLVWIFLTAAAASQIIFISIFHQSLMQIILVNTLVCGLMFLSIYIYFSKVKLK